MGTVVLKYKPSNVFQTYQAPSKSELGVKGDDGKKGTNGKSIYYTNYELDNSYYKKLCIGRIKANYILSNTSNDTLNRTYINGDLIMTPSKYIYRIKIDGDLVDIENVGKISDNEDEIHTTDISKISLSFGDSSYSYCIMPTNRGYFLDSSYAEPSARLCLGMNHIHTINTSLSDYEFSLEVLLKNTKRIVGGSSVINDGEFGFLIDPDKINSYLSFDFYKKIEFPLTSDSSSFISDVIYDKLHPSGNSISSSYILEPCGFNIYGGISYVSDLQKYVINCLINNITYWWFGEYMGAQSSYINNYYIESTTSHADMEGAIEMSRNYMFGVDEYTTERFMSCAYDRYSFNEFNDIYDTNVLKHEYIADKSHPDLYNINWRSGESSYFSGIYNYYDASIRYDSSMLQIERASGIDASTAVCNELKRFLLNKDNIYTLICRNISTGAVTRFDLSKSNIPIILYGNQ